MLKLKRVEIQGFKSFFDRTEMRFNGTGIAAVVGPNGCGKSNLSDSRSRAFLVILFILLLLTSDSARL